MNIWTMRKQVCKTHVLKQQKTNSVLRLVKHREKSKNFRHRNLYSFVILTLCSILSKTSSITNFLQVISIMSKSLLTLTNQVIVDLKQTKKNCVKSLLEN